MRKTNNEQPQMLQLALAGKLASIPNLLVSPEILYPVTLSMFFFPLLLPEGFSDLPRADNCSFEEDNYLLCRICCLSAWDNNASAARLEYVGNDKNGTLDLVPKSLSVSTLWILDCRQGSPYICAYMYQLPKDSPVDIYGVKLVDSR